MESCVRGSIRMDFDLNRFITLILYMKSFVSVDFTSRSKQGKITSIGYRNIQPQELKKSSQGHDKLETAKKLGFDEDGNV